MWLVAARRFLKIKEAIAMGLWKATTGCYVQGVLLEGGGIIELNEEQERAEKLGKFAEEAPDRKALRRDPESKAKVKIGNKNLVKVSKSAVAGMEGKGLDDGMILYPPQKSPIEQGQTSGDVHPTQFQHVR
jgi:hypothetical protein